MGVFAGVRILASYNTRTLKVNVRIQECLNARIFF